MKIVQLLKMVFQFQGRINRKKYILFVIFWGLSNTIVMDYVLEDKTFTYFIEQYLILKVLVTCFLFCWFVWFFQLFLVIAKRLRDVNLSGWWQIAMFLIPFGQLSFLALCFIKGTSGPNKYGGPPIN